MKKIAISAESTIDCPKDLLEKYNIHTLPFTVLLGDDMFKDGTLPIRQIFEFEKESGKLPKTSAVNSQEYQAHFDNLLKEYDEIIHITLSSEISSANQNANAVAEGMPNVHIIDSRALSTGIALLAIYASTLVSQGLSAEEIVEKVKTEIPKNQVSFVLSRVDYLYKGGRCGLLSLISATLLKIRPEILVEDGKMKPAKKYMGNFKKVVFKYVEETLEKHPTPNLDRVFVTHTSLNDELANQIKERLLQFGFKEVLITTAGATIASHCGEDCLGILFLDK